MFQTDPGGEGVDGAASGGAGVAGRQRLPGGPGWQMAPLSLPALLPGGPRWP